MNYFDKLVFTLSNGPLLVGSLIVALGFLLWYALFYFVFKYKGQASDLARTEAPQRLSPAACRYLRQRGFDPDCLIAGVINAVVKGCYKIKWRKNSFSISQNPKGLRNKLTGDERAALSFRNGAPIQRLGISQNHNRFTGKAEDRMRTYLQKKYRYYMAWPSVWVGIGLLLCLLRINWLYDEYMPFEKNGHFAYFLFLIPFGLGTFLLGKYFYTYKNWIVVGFCAFILSIFLYTALSPPGDYNQLQWPPLIPLLLVHTLLYSKLPTLRQKGAKLVFQIEEFRNYLKIRAQSEKKFGESEYYLIPYLIALDIPYDRSEYFGNLLASEGA